MELPSVVPRMTNNSLGTHERAEPRKKGGRSGITVRRFLGAEGGILGLLDDRATATDRNYRRAGGAAVAN